MQRRQLVRALVVGSTTAGFGLLSTRRVSADLDATEFVVTDDEITIRHNGSVDAITATPTIIVVWTGVATPAELFLELDVENVETGSRAEFGSVSDTLESTNDSVLYEFETGDLLETDAFDAEDFEPEDDGETKETEVRFELRAEITTDDGIVVKTDVSDTALITVERDEPGTPGGGGGGPPDGGGGGPPDG